MMKTPARITFSLFIFIILSERSFLANAQNTTIPVNVGVILNFDTLNGKMGFSCIDMALSDFYASNPYYKTRLVINSRDSKSDVVRAAAAGSLSLSLSLSETFCFLFFFFFFCPFCVCVWVFVSPFTSQFLMFSSYWINWKPYGLMRLKFMNI